MSHPIKVLAIVRKMEPAGLENRLMDIIRNINYEHVCIDVYTYQTEEGIYDNEIRILGGTVYYNPPLTVWNMFWYVNYFKAFLLNHPEYKIIHAYQDAWCSVFCKGAYCAGVPVRIAHSRTAINAFSLTYIIKNIIKLPTKKYATHYFAVSEKAGRWLYGDRLYEKNRVQIWPNAIDANSFYYNKSIREKVRRNNHWTDEYIVMHVGNFTYPKNHPFILEVFRYIAGRDEKARLVLVGAGNHEFIDLFMKKNEWLRNRISLLGSRRDINELLQGADVFLFPSIFEGLPGAVVEAQTAGLPCVISDTIAKEVCITPFVKMLALTENVSVWAQAVLDCKLFERENTAKYLTESGFDIHSLVKMLSEFYESATEVQKNAE